MHNQKHVQSLNWYRNLAQLYILEYITGKVSGMTKQGQDNSEYLATTVLEQVQSKLEGGK